MKKPEVARRIAREGGVTRGEAADQLDRLASDLLARLRRGEAAEIPGLGRFRRASGGRIRFDQEVKPRG